MKNAQNKRKILLVDADNERRDEMSEALKSSYHVIPAMDGEMALEILRGDQDFVAILLQCRLFEMSGFDVMTRLHTSRKLAAIPVIALGGPEDELKAVSLGAVAFFGAPKDPRLIACQLQNLSMLLQTDRDYDAMTGVLQWQPFLDAARDWLNQADEQEKYTMIFLNVDRFKVFNDLFGRNVGDQLLKNLAARLMVMKGVVLVGRVGGDRFVLCCRRNEVDMNRFRRLSGDLMRRLHLKYDLRICCGVYEIDDPTLPVGEICDRAQIAQDAIVNHGDRNVAYYDEKLRQNLLWEQTIATQMHEALEQNQFEVYLQPIYSISSNSPVSAEALVRWNHPTMGLIPPNRFIPVFERNGMISMLDTYVWERVFQYLAEFKKAGYPELSISANMSRMDIYNTDVCSQLTHMAEKYDVPPSVFRIEVTESAYMDDPQQLTEMTQKFNAAGFAVLMDDFGSGYSSLNMLMDMPVSTLKLDMGFIQAVGSNERTNCVVSSIVRMAKWLEMTVVAEGVETQVQIDYLRSIGCDRVQGYYFSKPIRKSEFDKLLDSFEGVYDEKPKRDFDEPANVDQIFKVLQELDVRLRRQTGAVAFYELTGDMLEIVNVNDAYYKLMDTSPAVLLRETQVATAWLSAKGQKRLMEAMDAAFETGERQDVFVERYINSTEVKNICTSVYYLGRREERKLMMFVMKDVTSQIVSEFAQRSSAPKRPSKHAEIGGRKQVLIVEDNQVNRLVLRKILSKDYEVLEATNGKEGLDMMESHPSVVAVLLDIIMPIMNGYEFLQSKAELPGVRDVPVLVLSQSENKASEVQARELGAAGFVRKPYDQKMLRELLAELIDKEQQGE